MKYEVILLLITATFSCLVVSSSWKGTKVRFQNRHFKTYGTTEFITLRPLVAPLLRSGATARALLGYNYPVMINYLYDETFEGENFCGFCDFYSTVNVLHTLNSLLD